MSRKITFLEIHLSDVQFNAPYSGRAMTTDDEDESVTLEAGGSGGSKLPMVVGLVGLVALAFLVRRLLKSESSPDESE